MSVIIDIEAPGRDVEIVHSVPGVEVESVVAVTRVVDPGQVDFSIEENYAAFLSNTTAKAAPLRLPASAWDLPIPLFDGSIGYLILNGRFSDDLINPPGRIKAKKLNAAAMWLLHADNPRPDGSLERFQTSIVNLNGVDYPFTVDWYQELFMILPLNSGISGALSTQAMYKAGILIHPKLRLPRKEEIDLFYHYPTPPESPRLYVTTSNNLIRTCTTVPNGHIVWPREKPNQSGVQTALTHSSTSNGGPPMLVCYLEEIPECGITA